MPDDDGLALAWHRRAPDTLALGSALGGEDAAERARALAAAADLGEDSARADAWWTDYWRGVPRVSLPDPALQRIWDYGLFKQAGLTPPEGVAATLQGAWMAETELPPWSNDCHSTSTRK